MRKIEKLEDAGLENPVEIITAVQLSERKINELVDAVNILRMAWIHPCFNSKYPFIPYNEIVERLKGGRSSK